MVQFSSYDSLKRLGENTFLNDAKVNNVYKDKSNVDQPSRNTAFNRALMLFFAGAGTNNPFITIPKIFKFFIRQVLECYLQLLHIHLIL